MRARTFTTSASAALLLAATLANAKHGIHGHVEDLHRRHRQNRELPRSIAENGEHGVELRAVGLETSAPEAMVEKRGGQCAFPSDAGLVAVAPGSQNAGWAMSPDQPCTPGNYCPYACPPGEVMMQWDPSATSYSYPLSMHGGLYCDEGGNIQKPFPDKPYCQSTATNIGVQNNAGGVVSFCQTVLPGNEAMLIPTAVTDFATLAMPGTDYWCGTAAHYYINPPGTSTDEACVWGTKDNPVGNWSPYVAGGNVDASGNTFIKLGWNPVYLETATPFRNNMPNWGVEIVCPNGGCNGLPCAIDPIQNRVNQMMGSASNGAGGGAFCVVTVEKGSTANFIITGGSGNQNGAQFFQSSSSSWSSSSSTSSSSSSSTTSTEWSSSTSASWTDNTTSTQTSTTSTRKPTHSPYYSLFNHSSTATNSPNAGVTESATITSATIEPSALPKTGSASQFNLSLAGLIASLFLGVTSYL